MAKPPKLANVERLDDLSHWLADTIQEKASKENAGFVQIERRAGAESETVTIYPGGGVKFVLTITQEANDADQG